nr:hypothetical protein [Fodinicola feengrottensis]
MTTSIGGNLSQLLYPALVLAVGLAANIMRTTRSAYLEAAGADFVRTVRQREKGSPASGFGSDTSCPTPASRSSPWSASSSAICLAGP